jgi:predicted ATPase/DNA-binding CsgD family transcriptional regulator
MAHHSPSSRAFSLLAHKRYYQPTIIAAFYVFRSLLRSWKSAPLSDSDPTTDPDLLVSFSKREREILTLLAENMSDHEIADHLIVAYTTVKWYNRQIFNKLGVNSRQQAVQRAMALGLLGKRETTTATTHHLPTATTAFVGRTAELNEIARLLAEPTCRLLTLVGPGGIGKTRLALEAARPLNFPNGVYFCPLQPLASSDLIVPAIAEALRFQFYSSDDPGEMLLDYLRDKALLLLLDNFEHLLDGVALVSQMLTYAPRLKVLTTSREALRLHDEWVYTVKGLRFPDSSSRESVEAYSALSLFVQSARRQRSDFTLQGEETEITRICQLVEGMPLGIELAAAWVDTLSAGEIADEIEANFGFLEAEFHDLPERHHSMGAIFQSSWQRLSLEEQESLSKLSIFADDFSRKAAQAIAGTDVRVLQKLINKSLLALAGSRRYHIHNLLRQFLGRQLQRQQYESLRSAFSRYYMSQLHQLEPRVKGKAQREALDEIETEFNHIRSAWLYALEDGDFAAIDQGVECIFWYCMMRNRYVEGETLLQMAADHFLKAGTLNMHIYGFYLWLRRWREGAYTKEAREHLERLLTLYQQTDDSPGLAKCKLLLGDALRAEANERERGRRLTRESLEWFETQGDGFYVAWVLHFMSKQAEIDSGLLEAIQLQQQSLDLRRSGGDLNGVIYALYNLSVDYLQIGRLDLSSQAAQEMLDLSRQMNELSGETMASTTLTMIALFKSEFEQAVQLNQFVCSLSADIHLPIGQMYGALVNALWALLNAQPTEAQALITPLVQSAPRGMGSFLCDLGLAMVHAHFKDEAEVARYLSKAVAYALKVHGTGLLECCIPVGAVWAHLAGELQHAEMLSAQDYPIARWLNLWTPIAELRATQPLSSEHVPVEVAVQDLHSGLLEHLKSNLRD